MAIKKIAIGGISTECSTYSPLYQNESDFVSLQGQTLLNLIDFPFDHYGIEIIPIFFNRSFPGGPIESQYFRETKDKFIAKLESLNTGKPYHLALNDEIPGIADCFRYYGGICRNLNGYAAGEYMTGFTSMIRRDPIGVVASIAPWNYPLMMAAWKIAPAVGIVILSDFLNEPPVTG